MRFPGFIGGSYQMRSITTDCQRCINLYADLDEMSMLKGQPFGAAKEGEIGALLGTPGIKLLQALPTQPNRGVWVGSNNGRVFVVSGAVLYELINTSGTWSYAALGTLLTNTGNVGISDNGIQLCIVDGPNCYSYTFSEKNILSFYTFTVDISVVKASVSAGAVYTDIGGTSNNYIALNTASFATSLLFSGTAAPTSGATTLQLASGSGDASIPVSASVASTTIPWQASTAYVVGQIIVPVSGGYTYVVTVAGTSGTTEPTFPTTRYATVTDGGVTWERTSSFATINDPGFLGSNIVAYQDGYFIFAKPNSNQVYASNIFALTFNALNFLNLGGSPDSVLNIVSLYRNLYIFTTRTCEIYYDAGISPGFPFARINGAYMQQGIVAQFSLAQTNNAIFWLGQDNSGQGIVYTTSQYQPDRISTFAVEEAFLEYSTISDAIAYTYQEGGHQFYVLNFPTAQATWVFDISTGLWHERAYNNNGVQQMQRGIYHTFAYGIHIVCDWENGNVYQQSLDVMTDNGAWIIRKRVAPHLAKDILRVFYSSFQIDIQQGDGLDGIQQGTDPQVMLRFSDDGGRSWSNIKQASFGKIGATKTRAIFRRLGQARDRVFEITISDPVFVALVGAELYLEAGAS